MLTLAAGKASARSHRLLLVPFPPPPTTHALAALSPTSLSISLQRTPRARSLLPRCAAREEEREAPRLPLLSLLRSTPNPVLGYPVPARAVAPSSCVAPVVHRRSGRLRRSTTRKPGLCCARPASLDAPAPSLLPIVVATAGPSFAADHGLPLVVPCCCMPRPRDLM